MKFSIAREELLRPLQAVSGVVEKRQTLPILSNVLVEVVDGALRFTGTDLEVELKANAVPSSADEGEITLPARKFMDICRALPDGAVVEFTLDEDKGRIRSGKSRFNLATLPATEFPSTEEVKGAFTIEVPQRTLKDLIERTQFCMANQDVRYYLNGMLLEVDGDTLRTVATDGHRLAVSEAELEQGVGENKRVIIPRKGVLELSRLLDADDEEPCRLELTNNHVRAELDGMVMTSKLVDGQFPDYERVIPRGGERIVTADRDVLKQGLARASILSNEKYRGIRLQFAEGGLTAMVNNPEQEEAEEQIDVEYQGEAFEIGFNVAYLLDALNAVRQATVRIEMTDSNSSCLVLGEGDESARYVVMPMRL